MPSTATYTSVASPGWIPYNDALHILIVDDSPADVGLVEEALRSWRGSNRLSVAEDGEEAMRFLQQQAPFEAAPRPDLILLDLNLPKRDGRDVLAAIKADPRLKQIPVIILSTSDSEQDVRRAYDLHANCYLTKPVHMDDFVAKIQAIEDFWIRHVRLPRA